MPEILGRHGWLYNETKALNDEGAILSCSGDSPFQLRLLKGVSNDTMALSKMCLYVPDPIGVSVKTDSRQQDEEESRKYREKLESQGVILPSTVDPVTGRRTDLNIEVNEKLPRESLMFLQSTFHTCPDILHMIVRSVESDLKLHVDALLKLEDLIAKAKISRLECNITERNVKPPRFKFEVADKLCKAVSLSFRDAEIIIPDCSRTSEYGRMDKPLFTEVYSFDTAHVYRAAISVI